MSAALLEATLLLLLVVAAMIAVLLRDVLAAVVAFAAYSLALSLLWVLFQAPDVALTEAAVGAGVVTVLFIATIAKTTRPSVSSPTSIRWPSVALVALFTLVVAITIPSLPEVGDPATPTHEHLAAFYLEQGPDEIGISNLVAAVLVGYRGFDTFGEVIVVFVAGVSVLLVLRQDGITVRSIFPNDAIGETSGTDPSLVAQTAIRLVAPFVALFGLYVTFHGAVSPGGGFQGGVAAAAAVILVGLAFGIEPTRRWLNHRAVVAVTVGGVLLFAAIGLGTIALGGVFLEYGVIPLEKATVYSIEAIEVAIAATVAGVVLVFFFGLVPGAEGGER